MPARTIFCAALLVLLPLSAAGKAQNSVATNALAPLSTRVVAYMIDAHVNAEKKSVDATETLTYRNLTGQPLTTFPFHLYLNAFQPASSFTAETNSGGGIRDSGSEGEYPAQKLGSITLTQLSADGFGELLNKLHFMAPDDGNPNDRTVTELTLPRPVAPGESITFHLGFHDRFPESVARNGYKRDFLMGGQWYPKLGVFWQGQWNCHQYHATTEFFSDFGTFDVRLTLPRNLTVGASGVPTGVITNSDGTRTLSFRGEDIHDFAWAASPNFNVMTDTYLSALGPVQVRVLALKAHSAAGPRYMKILLQSLRQFEDRFGPYPYKLLTLVDAEPGSDFGGMEYPTLITGDAHLWDPTLMLEETAEHEFGHQYWYGMVATNEFEDAWLDEGINSYTEVNVLAALLGSRTSIIRSPWANLSDASAQYMNYLARPDYDPVTRHAWQFRDAGSYNGITYGKSALLLKTLEGVIGRDTMDEAMRTYFLRFRFQHPTTEDFLGVIQEVAIRRGRAAGIPAISRYAGSPMQQEPQPAIFLGSSLTPFFKQAVYGTAMLDYAVDHITFTPVPWPLPDNPGDPMRSTVTIHRVGDFQLPVAVEITFSDGTRTRESWDSSTDRNDRWHTFTYTRTAHVVSAELDPEHTMLLDVDQFNNSRSVATDPGPARKLANLWLTAQQLGSQLAGWLI